MGYLFLGLVIIINGLQNHFLFFSHYDGKRGITFSGSISVFKVTWAITHLLVIVSAVRLLGWLFGGIFFGIYILNIFNLGIGWLVAFLLMKKTILLGTMPTFSMVAYFIYRILIFLLLVFTILVFFLKDFRSFKYELINNYWVLFIFCAVWIIGLIANKIIQKHEVGLK